MNFTTFFLYPLEPYSNTKIFEFLIYPSNLVWFLFSLSKVSHFTIKCSNFSYSNSPTVRTWFVLKKKPLFCFAWIFRFLRKPKEGSVAVFYVLLNFFKKKTVRAWTVVQSLIVTSRSYHSFAPSFTCFPIAFCRKRVHQHMWSTRELTCTFFHFLSEPNLL